MQDIVKTSGIWLFRTSLVSLAMATLIASGTTTGGGGTGGGGTGDGGTGGGTPDVTDITSLHVTGKIDDTAKTKTILANDIVFSKSGDDITIKRVGKTYSFKAADLKTTNGLKSYTITVGDETITLQNMSTEFLQDSKKYTTNNVDMWWAKIEDEGKGIEEEGYFVIGSNVPDKLPTTGKSTYKGGMAGYFLNTDTGVQKFYLGDSTLNVDFATQNVTGGMTNILTSNNESFGPDIIINGGKIAASGFLGALTYSGGAASTGGAIIGDFNGADASEMGGIGQIESENSGFSFAFTAKK